MTKQPLSVTEMFSSIMKLLEQAGYAKHALWGNMYGSLRSVVSFYHEKGLNDYDPAVTLEFLQAVKNVTVRAASAGHGKLIQDGRLPSVFRLVDHPLFVFCKVHVTPPKFGYKKAAGHFCLWRALFACGSDNSRKGIPSCEKGIPAS